MKILLTGYLGRMSNEVRLLAESGYDGETYDVFGVDPFCEKETERLKKDFSEAEKNVDCVIDFSNPALTKKLLSFVTENRLPVVVATTGHTEAEKAAIIKAAKEIPVFYSSNFSVGIAVLKNFVKKAVAAMPDADVEITEIHHNGKADAPSGTAISLAEEIKKARKDAYFTFGRKGNAVRNKNEIGIHSIRLGNVVGEHEVMIGGKSETIILTHRAADRRVFAEGALKAAKFIINKKNGLFGMEDLLGIKGENI